MNMTDQDKSVSRIEMRRRLYYRFNLISSFDADNSECAHALRTFPDIEQIAVLHRIVGADGVWAALEILRNDQDQAHSAQAPTDQRAQSAAGD